MATNPKAPHADATVSLSHIANDGRAQMVDVGDKPITARSATAEGFVRISTVLADRIRENALAKGSVLEIARLAGILGAKRTDELIPLCHTLPLDSIDITTELQPDCQIRITATVSTQSRTGVEMEALTAVAIACLTVVDMGKAVDKSMVIDGIRVVEKHGGRSGSYVAPASKQRSPS